MIELAAPWGLAALAAIPIIVALHFLRPRRRTVVVPSAALWHEALRERQRGLGLQRLLRDLSLILLLLLAAVLALALADPRWLTPASDEDDAVVILDVSASMQARDGRSTRFERAMREAERLVDEKSGDARMLLMTSGRKPVLRSGFETDDATLRLALASIEPTDEAGRPREALVLALAMLRNRETGRIHLITDAAFDDDIDIGAPRIEYHETGGAGRNVAITRFDLRPEFGAEDRFQVLLAVRNYTGEALRVPARVSLDGRVLLERALDLAPGERETLVVAMQGNGTGRALAEIDVDDDLAADNRAHAVVGVDEVLRVLLLTPGNFYLESALEALPNVLVTRHEDSSGDLARAAQLHDVVVADRVDMPALPPGRFLLVDSLPPGLPFAASGSVSRPVIIGHGASALMRRIDLAAVRIDEARRVALTEQPAGLQRLFWSADTELALALLRGDTRLVYLGFDLTRSNLPLQAAFPLFLGQSLAWLRPRATRLERTQVAAGESVSLPVAASARDVIVRTPAGEGVIHEADGGSLRFEATSTAGIYRYTAADVRRYFAVNLTDEAESDIAARATLPAARGGPALAAGEGAAEAALWSYLALAALALLALEWGLWSWRRAGA